MARRQDRNTERGDTSRGPLRSMAHIIEDISYNYVEKFIVELGYIAQAEDSDYGYDLFIRFFDYDNQGYGEALNGFVWVQLKATTAPNYARHNNTLSFNIEITHVNLWRKNSEPVLLVVYDVEKSQAYWVDMKSIINDLDTLNAIKPHQKTITIHLPVNQKVNREAIRMWRRMRDTSEGESIAATAPHKDFIAVTTFWK
jgi:hypothetical protein